WGATLYDFYHVRAVPQALGLITMTSGSRIAAAVRAVGETDVAADELAWADQEADPYEVPVVDPGEQIECKDSAPKNGIMSVLMSDRPLSSPFHPSYYPEPWPFIPLSNLQLSTLLQKRIPLHLLPETLYVHDPYDLLSVCLDHDSDSDEDESERDTISWLAKPPRVYKYKLNLIRSARDTAQKARKDTEEEEKKKKRVLHVYRFPPTEEELTRGEPTYDVPLPTEPPALTQVEEAHLYISPARKLGTGHHSVVYKAEFELPRDLFLEPNICTSCVFNSLQKEVRKLKKSGKWRKMLHAVGCEPPPKGDDEGSDEEDYEMPVPYEEVDQEVIFTTPHRLRVYCPEIRWQDPHSPCEHARDRYPRPRTAMFQVAAKLSVQTDGHLAREARNYQSFPDHFFQHWSGYNLIRPLHGPVPVHALVPQFYGYYVPDKVALVAISPGGETQCPPYLSPILLLEDCGVPVVPSKLTKDEREECASLLLRFIYAGWLHDSVAKRNFLVQKGPPTMWPLERSITDQLSFRLIDFGRSRLVEESKGGEFHMAREEALKLFNMPHGLFEPFE
ncbi:hypothetical protein J3A83DRAFT_4114299, partial [Scleroderma citrinum]